MLCGKSDMPGKANSGSCDRSGMCTVCRERNTLGASDLSWMLLGLALKKAISSGEKPAAALA